MSAALTTLEAQLKLLESDDPKLAANKRLVFDMYREIVQGGHADRVEAYFTEGYIQHNPNVASGRQALADFLRGSRPARPLEDRIMLPIVNMIAEGDYVVVLAQRPETDAEGNPYVTSWFDFYRIEDGLIAEHWDPALKSAEMLRFDPNTKRMAEQ
ncbi:MAG TPA: nuclear transport factor 2 family protein [Sphingobium sp.]|nr:nuclear transport factor 2 family protein [Sphingobium sp.]